MNKMNKKGFTIVELVIVIAVIAILAGVLIPTFGGIIDRANASAEMQQVASAYKLAYADAIANDGKVTTADYNAVKTTTTGENPSKDCIKVEGYDYEFELEEGDDGEFIWKLAESDDFKYAYNAADGSWTVEAK